MAERIKKLYVHCSASRFGNENLINHWHKLRRFMTMWKGVQICIGYQYIVGNGKPHDNVHYYSFLDGNIETARPDWIQAAAVKGDNKNTVHVCLIGEAGKFTKLQIESLYLICRHYIMRGLSVNNVVGHYEYWIRRGEQPRKICPGINMDKFRNDLKTYMTNGNAAKPVPIKINTKKDLAGRLLNIANILLGGIGGQT